MRWMFRIAVVGLVSSTFALTGPPTAQSSAQSPTLSVTPGTGLVGGDAVTIKGTGFPASVEVSYCEGVITPNPSISDCGTTFESVNTDATGAFSVPFSVFRFITPANTANPSPIDCAQPTAQCAIGAMETSPIFGPIVRAPITFTSQTPSTFAIKGSVTGPDGHPVANADVWAYTPADTWIGSLTTVTDGTGAFELDGTITPQFDYRIRFGPPAGTDLVAQWFNDQTHRSNAQRITLPKAFNDPPVITADAQLAAGGAITGVVTDSAGAGVSGVTVWSYGPGDTWVGSFGTTTAADGSYRISGVRAADYKVRFMPTTSSGLAIEWFHNATTAASATKVTVTAGTTAGGIDDQLSPSP